MSYDIHYRYQLISPECSIYPLVNWVTLCTGNDFSPVWRQAITWTNADLLSFGPLGTNFIEIRIEIQKKIIDFLLALMC